MLTSTMATNGTPSANAAMPAAAAIQIWFIHPPSLRLNVRALRLNVRAGMNLRAGMSPPVGRSADTPSFCLVEKLYSPSVSV